MRLLTSYWDIIFHEKLKIEVWNAKDSGQQALDVEIRAICSASTSRCTRFRFNLIKYILKKYSFGEWSNSEIFKNPQDTKKFESVFRAQILHQTKMVPSKMYFDKKKIVVWCRYSVLKKTLINIKMQLESCIHKWKKKIYYI